MGEVAAKVRATALLLGVLCAGSAVAEERWDHRGSVGLLLAVGADARNAAGSGSVDNGFRSNIDLGGTLSITDRSELLLDGRLSLLGERPQLAAIAGFRSSYALERWKTFLEPGVITHFGRLWTIGVRVAVGLQYELLPVLGVYASIGGEMGWGAGLRIAGDAQVGLQFRSFLLE